MRILYFIYSSGNASGGHFHSLNQISREIGKQNKAGIVSIGPNISPVIAANPYFLKHISLKGNLKEFVTLNKAVGKVIKNFNPDILHSFDTNSFNRILVLPSTFNYPVVLNKCGGPNPLRNNYQHANALVVFSAENYNWFSNNKNYKNESIHLIPNRVERLNFLPESKQIEKKDPNKITFLRVTRIGGAYEKTLRDSFRMIEALMHDYPVQLFVVGKIQDKARYEWFKNEATQKKIPVKFITDERVSRGADFLYLADFVIGTGRSFMEALSLGIPSLTPAKNADWPLLVDQSNFTTFFNTNFSERNSADTQSIETNRSKVDSLINDKSQYAEAQEAAVNLFNEHFGTDPIAKKYTEVYKKILEKRNKRTSLIFKNLAYILRTML